MNKKLLLPLLLISMIFFGCSKSSQPNPQNNNGTKGSTGTSGSTGSTGSSGVKIEIVSGNDQTDTIGYPHTINVKVTSTSGASLAGYGVLYEASGCNVDNPSSVNLAADGTSGYIWRLAGDVGQQSLKIVVLDAQNKHVDSTTAVSKGIAPAIGGWHYSACTYPFGFDVLAMCKLSTGRMFLVLAGGPAYLRYSDDNGVSWNSVKGLGNTHRLQSVVSTPTDEVFVVTDDGNYYSGDAGQTWTSLGMAGFNSVGAISGITYTSSGKLFVTTQFHSLYISSDKGKTWTVVPSSALINPRGTGGGDTDFGSPSSDQNGNLYVLSDESGTIYKSTDVGKTWTALNLPSYQFESLFIDKNNWFYTSVNGQPSYGVYVSKDNGATFNILSNSTTGFNQGISVQSDGNLYYTIETQGLYKLNGVSGPAKMIFSNVGFETSYIVAKNNNVVVGDRSLGFLRYNNK
jgi:hypothetical protein